MKGKAEMNASSLKSHTRTIVIIGDIELESIEDRITSLGYSFKKINPFMDGFNFARMRGYLNRSKNSGKLLAVIFFLTASMIMDICTSGLTEKWLHLLEELKNGALFISVNKDNLLGSFYDSINVDLNIMHEKGGKGYSLHEVPFSKFSPNNASKRAVQILHSEENEILSYSSVEITLVGEIWIEEGNFIKEIYVPLLKSDQTQIHLRRQQLQDTAKRTNHFVEQIKRDLEEEIAEELQRAEHLLQKIQSRECEIASYKNLKELVVQVQHFLDEIDKGVLLHLYVPNGRYQEDQLASFLRLFESYLQRVENLQFFIETRKTLHGQIYEFKSKNSSMNITDMEVALSRFESFMSLCQNDQKKAEDLLLRTGMNPSEASRLMTKYIKEYQRLLLDIEHERERKMLDLRQRLESDALELTNETSLAVTQSVQPAALLSLPHTLEPLSITISNSSVTINPGLQSYIEQAIYGDIHYTTEDKELIHLFAKYTEGLETVRLKSELEQLKDETSPEAERKTAKQKIAGFLSKVAPAIGQSVLTVLTAYLEKLLTGK